MTMEFEMTGRRPSKNGSAEGRRDDEEYSYGSRDRAILANLGKKQALKVSFRYELVGDIQLIAAAELWLHIHGGANSVRVIPVSMATALTSQSGVLKHIDGYMGTIISVGNPHTPAS